MNRSAGSISTVWACAGAVVAPLAWIVSVQISQILPHVDCVNRTFSTAICAAVATAVALMAAAHSWRVRNGVVDDDGQPRRFIGLVASLTAIAISFALMLQLLASLMLDPCER